MGNTGQCCDRKDVGKQGELSGIQEPQPPGVNRLPAPNLTLPEVATNQGEAEKATHDAVGGTLDHQEMTYKDGSTYKGQFSQEGKRHGQGVWSSQNGKYEGKWENDHQHGEGKQTWADGRVYTGEFAMGKFEGHGRMEWHTTQGLMVYDGQYSADKKHGSGKFVWPDGRTYDGEWLDGKRSGKALYQNSSGELKWGLWKEDKLERWLDENK